MTTATGLPVIDPADLNAAQRSGAACVVCDKRWPRPRRQAGTVPGGARVNSCEECAVLLQLPAVAGR